MQKDLKHLVVEEGECGNVVLKVLFGGGVAFEVAADVGVKIGEVTEGNEKFTCPTGWVLGLFHVCSQAADEVLSLIALIKERELFFAGKLLKHYQQILVLSDFVTASVKNYILWKSFIAGISVPMYSLPKSTKYFRGSNSPITILPSLRISALINAYWVSTRVVTEFCTCNTLE